MTHVPLASSPGWHELTATTALCKNADPFALDRQYWVTLKRKLTGLDKTFNKPFIAPTPLDGKAARWCARGRSPRPA